MDGQRILKEAQKIASEFSFWMVSGNIAHLYGHVYETPEKKYELEIKFGEDFPDSPPQLIYHNAIKNLLGNVKLNKLRMWTPGSAVVDILKELNLKIQETMKKTTNVQQPVQISEVKIEQADSEEYITPDLDAYPPELENNIQINSSDALFYSEPTDQVPSKAEDYPIESSKTTQQEKYEESIEEPQPIGVEISTELGLIQQYYAYDQKGQNPADITIYMTLTITKTFIIDINFMEYPQKPIISLPEQLINILGNPYESINMLKKWNVKKPVHIIDILHEIENNLQIITHIENEAKKILNEYKCEEIEGEITKLKVHLVTYGFKEYVLELDLTAYPKPPEVILSSELQNIIHTPINSLNSYKNWKENESEPVEIIREIAWLVDKNSRINFEIELLNEHYKDLKYENTTQTLKLNMKGKMKTQDITFEFQINLPKDYPMKMPNIKVLNEFEIDTHEKIKSDLQSSFKDFFEEWTPYSYLIDLFNLISEKIFEVSVVACVICHKIECPTCGIRIAGRRESCHVECPHCERAYHKHCWEQTIKSFGKCGFCLKPPPPEMIY